MKFLECGHTISQCFYSFGTCFRRPLFFYAAYLPSNSFLHGGRRHSGFYYKVSDAISLISFDSCTMALIDKWRGGVERGAKKETSYR